MDDQQVGRWQDLALGIVAVFNPGPVVTPGASKESNSVRSYFRKHREALCLADEWPHHLRAALTGRIPPYGMAQTHDSDIAPAFAAKAIIVAHALLTGTASCLGPHERDAFLSALDSHAGAEGDGAEAAAAVAALREACSALRAAPVEKVVPHAIEGGTLSHPFAFAWSVYKSASYATAIHAGEAVAVVSPVDAAEAPVAVRLRRPDGGWLDVRNRCGEWFRPVLAPDGRSTMGMAEYAAHAAAAPAWADNPYIPWPKAMLTPLSLADFHPVGAPSTERAANALARDEASARAAAGPVILVDGVVHRRTHEPMLTLVRMRDGMYRPSWTLGKDLSGTVTLAPFLGERRPTGMPQEMRGYGHAYLSLPPDCLAVVAALGRLLRGSMATQGDPDADDGQARLYGHDLSGLVTLTGECVPDWGHDRAMSILVGAARESSADMADDRGMRQYYTARDVAERRRASAFYAGLADIGAGCLAGMAGHGGSPRGAVSTGAEPAKAIEALRKATMGDGVLTYGEVLGKAIVLVHRAWRAEEAAPSRDGPLATFLP